MLFLWTSRYRCYLVLSKYLYPRSLFNSVIPIYTFQVKTQNDLSYIADSKPPRKHSTCSNCGKHGHNKRNCPRTSSNTPAPACAPVAQPKARHRNSRAEEIKDENGIQPPLHDDPDESDDDDEEMLGDFKLVLEKLVWTEVPAMDPPTLPDGTPWDGRPLFDSNTSRPEVQLFQQTFPDWEQHHKDYIFHLSVFLTAPMCTKMLTATNAYGRLYVSKWSDLNGGEELGAFLGIVIHMGIYIYPERRKYWQRGEKGDRWVQSIMSRERFEQILKAWHVEDYSGRNKSF